MLNVELSIKNLRKDVGGINRERFKNGYGYSINFNI